ncbi:MAG: DUF5702 domain-containing protein, partial [Oscillospiraceae bacterium]|nr:DUF5702 domain-containing protein [Oscillospiraceae bacterium]
ARGAGESGGVSLYLAIILIAFMVMAGTFVDFARVRAAENQVYRSLDAATLSMLAQYDTKLKNDYGIFALRSPAGDQEGFMSYLESNLSPGGPNELRLYDYRVESAVLAPVMPLADIDVLEMQILEYMKYRAPISLVAGILDFFTNVQRSAEIMDSMKIKLEIDRKLGEIGKYQQLLRDRLYGDVGVDKEVREFFVRNFDNGGIRRRLADDLTSEYTEYARLVQKAYKAQLEAAKNPDSAYSDYNFDVDNAAIYELRGSVSYYWQELYTWQTVAFLDSNKKAVEYINKIIEIGKEASELVDRLEINLEREKSTGGGGSPGSAGVGGADAGAGAGVGGGQAAGVESLDRLKGGMENSVKSYRESLMETGIAAKLVDQLESNISVLSQVINSMNGIRSEVIYYSGEDEPLKPSQIYQSVLISGEPYNSSVEYDYKRTEKGGNYADPRGTANDKIKEATGKTDKKSAPEGKGPVKLSALGINMGELPSKNPVVGGGKTGANDEEPKRDSEGVDTGELAANVNLKDNQSTFSENAMGILSYAKELLVGGIRKTMNNLYVNEYILSMFKNGSKDKYLLNGDKAGLRKSFFEAEVEYILYGDEDQGTNMAYVRIQLFLVRFAMNFLHVYSDSDKMLMASEIATSIAGAWSAGIAVPVVTNLIVAAWSASESILDVNDLIEGKRVPFFKLEGDWVTSVGVVKEDALSTDDSFKNTYIDYLRLFLLMENRGKKLGRINDLLEINSFKRGDPVKVQESYCALSTELEISISYLFLTRKFMPEVILTDDGRHRLTADLTRGLF